MIDKAEVWLYRHGIAGDNDPKNTRAQDAARTLTGKGVKQSRRAGKVLAKVGPEFSAIYTSPAVRCVHGAELIGEQVGVEPVVKPQLGEPPSSGNIVPLAREGQAIVIVGHGHYFPDEIKKLTGRQVDVDKGGLVGISISHGQGKVTRLLSPKDIKGML